MTPAAAFSITLLRRRGFEVAMLDTAAGGAGFPRHTHDEFVLSANLAGAEWIWLDGREHEAGPGQVTAYNDEFVLSANLAGAEWIWLDGREHEAGPGQVTAYNPGALQASRALGPVGARWSFVSLYVEPAFAAEALGLAAPPTLGRAVIADPAVAARLLSLGALFGGAAREAPALLDEAAVGALSAVARGSGAAPRIHARDPTMDRVAALLTDRLSDPPDLATLAREAALSREHLVRRFAARFGLPPMAWALQRRLARARVLLRHGMAPAEVAASLGFADQAHLTRAFRGPAGITPGRYRRGG